MDLGRAADAFFERVLTLLRKLTLFQAGSALNEFPSPLGKRSRF
jgi:hypothetical protein